MYVKNIVICDCEKQYAKNLLQIFSGKKVAGIRLYLFDTVEEAAEFSEKETIHVLLIAGEYFQKLESPIPAKTCFLLTRELSEKAGAGGREIYRYQSAEAIWNRMMEAEKQCIDKKYFPEEETEGELIGVYSPIHRIGKTRFAIELGKRLAEKEPSIYLNLEEYSGGNLYFPGEQDQTLGDLLYYCSQERKDFGLRISSMTGQAGKPDYVYPIACVQDLRAVEEREWLTLLECILEQCVYGKVILDLGDSITGLYSILMRCDTIYTPVIEEAAALAKMSQYTENLRKMGLEEVLEKTVQVKMRRKIGAGKKK